MLRVLVLLGALCGLVIAFNVLIDPFYRFNLISLNGINAYRSAFAFSARMAKAENICRVQPEQIAIGGSKIEVAIDPRSPVWGAGKVYNMGLAGMPLSEMAQTLPFIARNAPLKRAVIGLDFMHFNQLREDVVYKTEVIDFDADRLAGNCIQAFAHDLNPLLGPKAVRYSLQTALDQRTPKDGDISLLGELVPYHSPLSDAAYFAILFDGLGYRSTFSVAYKGGANGFGGHGQEEYYVEKIWRPGPKHAYEFGNTFDVLMKMDRHLEAQGVDARYFIEPLHARMLVAIDDAGLWPQFEEMKRKIVAIAPVWDFGLNTATEDPNNYWEPSHYKEAMGNTILCQTLDHCNPGFGIELTSLNIDDWLIAQRRELAAYRQREPEVAAGVDAAVKASLAKAPAQ